MIVLRTKSFIICAAAKRGTKMARTKRNYKRESSIAASSHSRSCSPNDDTVNEENALRQINEKSRTDVETQRNKTYDKYHRNDDGCVINYDQLRVNRFVATRIHMFS